MMMMMKFMAAATAVLISTAANADVSISKKPTQNMNCNAGVCTATAQKAMLNVGDLQTMLASGDVAVKTGTLAKDIAIDQPLSWTSTSRLTLDAQQSVVVRKPVTVAGTGALTITTNDGGQTGQFRIALEHGRIQFADLASSLVINGNAYTLVKDIHTLAADIEANPNGFYSLADDFDASIDGTYGSAPVATTLQGTFEGLGNTIRNLRISSSDQYVGLFKSIGKIAVVRDLRMLESTISGTGGNVINGLAALAGLSNGKVESILVSGKVSSGVSVGVSSMGGIVGVGSGQISDSLVDITVSDGASHAGNVGGLAGGFGGSVTSSSAAGAIDTPHSQFVGGLVGVLYCNEQGPCGIATSKSSSSVVGQYVGGLVGQLIGSSIESSFARSKVVAGYACRVHHAYSTAGGLVGFAAGAITNSYATGSVTGSDSSCIGGLFGWLREYPSPPGVGSLMSSYSTAAMSGGDGAHVGGVGGRRSSKDDTFVGKSYWDVDTSGVARGVGHGDSKGTKPLTDAQLKAGLPDGFDPKIWGSDPNINNGYPYLLANPPR